MSAADSTTRWETVYATSERLEGDLVKITVEGLTDADRAKAERIGFVVVVDDAAPFDRHHKMRRLVSRLDRMGIA